MTILNILHSCESSFNWELPFTALISIFGYYLVHRWNRSRDLRNKKRELTLEYLIRAFQTLVNDINQRVLGEESKRKFEDVISDVQLFGSKEQVEMAILIKEQMTKGDKAELDNLINSLRDTLRKELNLEKVDGNVHWMRFLKDHQ